MAQTIVALSIVLGAGAWLVVRTLRAGSGKKEAPCGTCSSGASCKPAPGLIQVRTAKER